ncbi:YczE/YyaS/YitT family protein [Sporosarcina jiandibaonis]|uniref:YczE/YyaS/YitT family protein n=1 Tax=Sporosarcina jiandibaonis TaxID=2715535 RepID=UPI002483FF50|nr:DUF6198 family protein [Sporosarcina jiandibaonis]
MNQMTVTMKRLFVYIIGLFVLSLGVSFSIQAGLGVSPVSSLAYAFTLTAGLSIGITTVLANILFIICQAIIRKQINIREFLVQLIIAFLFGFFMDATLFIVQLFPAPETLIIRYIFLILSLFIVSIGLFNYFTAKLPLMPYDALTYIISEHFKLKFSRAKITSDLINVGVAGAVCLIFIQSLGSIGIGTLAAAYFIGKMLGWMMKNYEQPLHQWIFRMKS